MNRHLWNAALRVRGLRGAAKVLLLVLAFRADKHGVVRLSAASLAQQVRTSPRNAARVIAEVRAAGMLDVKRGADGINEYRLRLPAPPPPPGAAA